MRSITPKQQTGKFIQGFLDQPWANALNTISKVSAVPIRELVSHAMIEFIKTKADQFCLTEIKQLLNKEKQNAKT